MAKGKIVKGKNVLKAIKKAKPKSNRQTGDYPVSGSSAKQLMPKTGKSNAEYLYGRDTQISKNVSIKNNTTPSGKSSVRGGAAQVMNQNSRLSTPLSKAEVKANARALKAANKKVSKRNRIRIAGGIGGGNRIGQIK